MNDDKQQLYGKCLDNEMFVFNLIKAEEFEVIEKLITDNKVNVNIVDGVGNDVVMRLLKAKKYDLVLKLMKKKNWNVNKQNFDGNTFGHILAQDDSLNAIVVMDELKKKKDFSPNIQNNRGETALDKAINNNYLATAFKLLSDKRFDNVDISLVKNLFNVCIKNNYYGKYSKISNLEILVDSLEKKTLGPILKRMVEEIKQNFEMIKKDIMNNRLIILESIINEVAVS